MPLPPPWLSFLLLLLAFLLQGTEACVDSSGDFYCASLWYFWFGIFWFCIAIFIGVMCIVNRCNKKKSQIDVQFQLPTTRSTQNCLPDGSLATSRTESSH